MPKAYSGFANLSDATDDLDTMRFVVGQALNGLATATLVIVKAVGAGTVDVQPMVHQIDGAANAIEHGTIHAMPFLTMRAGASAVKLTPRVGDIGLAVFCHNDISSAKKTQAPSVPGTRRRFDWADGVYLGGLLGATSTQFIEIDDDTGITITSAVGVTINGDVTVTGDLTASGTITGTTDVVGGGKALKTHTHGGVATGSGTTGAPS